MAFLKLTYPVYTASFDPYNNDFLFVGGGGGEGRSGIPNKVTLLDTSSPNAVNEVAQIDLSREEDSVQSLAVAHSDSSAATVYAGINSSQADQDAGNNEHLRAIRVPYPPRKGAGPASADPPKALSKASLFTFVKAPRQETYQKVLRLSPARADITTRLGAVATRDAPAGEVVLFDASKQTPATSDVLHRVQLGKGEEAGDVDITEGRDGGYLVTYCTDANIQVIKIDSVGKVAETRIFEGSKRDGSFRSLRFLDQNHVLAVRNAPRKSGAQILIFNFPTKLAKGIVVFGKGLHKGFNAALALDVARLPALDGADARQYIAAVAGQDGSLVLFTINQDPKLQRQMKMKQHSLLKDLHPAGITSLTFSQFKIPYSGTATTPLRLKLASTSFANTVVVHTFPLKSQPNPRQATHQILATPPQRTAGDSILSLTTGALVVAFVAILIQAISELQGNARNELLHVRQWAPAEIKYFFDATNYPHGLNSVEGQSPTSSVASQVSGAVSDATGTAGSAISEAIASMQNAASEIPSAEEVKEQLKETVDVPALEEITQHVADLPQQVQAGAQKVIKPPTEQDKQNKQAFKKIRSILHAHHRKDDQPPDVKVPGAVMLTDTEKGLKLSTHEHEDHLEGSGAKKWEELSKEEQHIWKKRLLDAGHWVEGETEAIVKGVFFGTLAGLVNAAVAG